MSGCCSRHANRHKCVIQAIKCKSMHFQALASICFWLGTRWLGAHAAAACECDTLQCTHSVKLGCRFKARKKLSKG